MAFDNVTPGFRRLYYPNLGAPWQSEGEENLIKDDSLEILLIATDGGGLALDLAGFGASSLFIITNRALQIGPDAQFSFGMAPLFSIASMNVPHNDVSVRAPGFLHTAIAPEFSVAAAAAIGFFGPIGPGMPPGMAQFIIWETDSQSFQYKAAERSMAVMFSGGPP